MSEFSERLTNLRENKGWSKTYVAKTIGLSSMQTYANWEYGRTEPDFETTKKLANLFNVSTDYLLGRDPKEDNLKTADKNVQLIAAHIDDGTTPEEMNDILTYIDFIKSKREKK